MLASDREDGVLGPGVGRFAENANERLEEISGQILSGTFVPGKLAPVALPKDDGGMRFLHIPVVRDRVAERAILAVLTPIVDPCLGPFSYAYRPGLGVADAVQALARLLDEAWGGWPARTFTTVSAIFRSGFCGG